MYRIENLSFVSNMEASFSIWPAYPWHIVCSTLRCMACQDWQVAHTCPICKKTDRDINGVRNPWAYFHGCHHVYGTRRSQTVANVYFSASGQTFMVSSTDAKSSVEELPISSAEEPRMLSKVPQRDEDCEGTTSTD